METDFFKIFNIRLNECITEFSSEIKNGIGWIVKEDVMRQFLQMFPEFDVPIINQDVLESLICNRLQAYIHVIPEDEAYEKGLLS